MKLAPVVIEVLLHCHSMAEPHPRAATPAVQGALSTLRTLKLIEVDDDAGASCYKTSLRGVKMVEMICETPLPEQRWEDPREDK